MLLGSADELHQRFVPRRTSTITDVGFDVCGRYLALMMLFAAIVVIVSLLPFIRLSVVEGQTQTDVNVMLGRNRNVPHSHKVRNC